MTAVADAAGRRPCPPVRDLLPPDDIETAYAVQTALGPMVAVSPGDTFRADIIGLGSVRATFTTDTQEVP